MMQEHIFMLTIIVWMECSAQDTNLALGKAASQSSPFGSYTADRAVNGIKSLDDFSHTQVIANQWWYVDLGDTCLVNRVLLYNRMQGLNNRLRKISILTCLSYTENPSRNSTFWNVSFYQEQAFGDLGTIELSPAVLVRYLAVYGSANEGVALVEVEVFGLRQGPSTFELKATSGNCLNLTWSPLSISGASLEYQYYCGIVVWTNTATLTASVCELKPYSEVSCGVRGLVGMIPTAATVNASRTLCAEPSIPSVSYDQTVVSLAGKKRISITVTWKVMDVNCLSLDSLIIDLSSQIQNDKRSTSSLQTGSVTITDLEPYENYTLIVTAVNNQRLSSASSQTILTKELEPYDAPRDFTVLTLNSSCVALSWRPPQYPNGLITHYVYSCSTDNQSVPQNSSEMEIVTLCGFKSHTDIFCEVRAMNGAGPSPVASGSDSTDMGGTDVTQIHIITPEQSNHTGIIAGIVVGGGVLIIVAVLLVVYTKRRRLASRMEKQGMANHAYEKPGSGALETHPYERVHISTLSAAPIIEDKFPSTAVKITNTEQHKGSNSAYPKKQPKHVNIDSQQPTSNQGKVERGPDQELNFINKYLEERNNARDSTDHLPVPISTSQEHKQSATNSDPSEPMRQQSINGTSSLIKDAPSDAMYSNADIISIQEIEPFIETSQGIMGRQFERLDVLPKGEMTVALLPENKGKSRYRGLYPVNSYRVKLEGPPSQGTDYINASHIQGYNGVRKYIAAQGPTEDTVNDFWFMIWQQKVSSIVMVTNLWEDGKKKCEKYWPDKHGTVMEFGNFMVKTESEELWADFVLRTLLLTHHQQTRLVKQFHYLSWPDHGVPNESNPFVLFYLKVVSHIGMMEAPLLVHCSAGVGRTGTFISLDYLLAQAKDLGLVDVFDCVKRLRERRPSMVQTQEQYIFLHKVLAEAIITQDFITLPSQISERLSSLGFQSGRKTIREEFLHIEKLVNSKQMAFEAGKSTANKERNRFQNILPNDLYRVYLTRGRHDYINAISIDGYRVKGHLIITQLPLANTVSDFWQMVTEQASRSVIQLGRSESKYLPPLNQSLEVGTVTIENTNEETDRSYRTITLEHVKDVDSVYMAAQTIKVFEVDWAADKTLPSVESLLDVLVGVEKWQQQSGNHKIVIMCKDGATQSGVVACAFNSVERLKAEQDVDVYNPVLMCRLRRPEIIKSMEHYVFIYRLLQSYAEAFSEYSNFM